MSTETNDLAFFEGHKIRKERADNGDILYNGHDVTAFLKFKNGPDAIRRHCRPDGIVKRDTVTPNRGTVEMTYLTEGNVIRLITKAKVPNAEACERWIFDDAVPTILKTGSYTAPGAVERMRQRGIGMTDKTRAIMLIGREFRRMWPTAKTEVVASWTLDQLKAETGLNTDALRLALPLSKGEEIEKLNATEVGALCGLTARQVNERLLSLGYQRKQPKGGYEVTVEGQTHGAMYPFTRNGHSGLEVRWKATVADVLRSPAPTGVKFGMLAD